MKNLKKILTTSILSVSLLLTMAACGDKSDSSSDEANSTTQANSTAATTTPAKKLSGKIIIDGSSTVYPITQAVAEEFKKAQGGVEISVALSGTGGGMKKFYAGEIDICDASRAIKQEEIDKCKEKGIEYVEFKIAYDGISVVVNKDNKFLETITVAELKKIWEKGSTVKSWKEVNSTWPDQPIKLYGPGTDSGTFEFFTEVINGKAKEARTDFVASEDDNTLVQGVAGDKNAMGYFGYAYYEENKDKLKVLKIDTGSGAVAPSFDTIKNLSYKPLSRPLYLYVNKKKLNEEHVKEFMNFYITNATKLVKEVDYVPLDSYTAELAKLK